MSGQYARAMPGNSANCTPSIWASLAAILAGCGAAAENSVPMRVGAPSLRMVRAGCESTCGVDISRSPPRLRCGDRDNASPSPGSPHDVDGVALGAGLPRVLDVGCALVCALDHDGALSCWGDGFAETDPGPWRALSVGEDSSGPGFCVLGPDGHAKRRIPADPRSEATPDTPLTTISISHAYACGLTRQSLPLCWGVGLTWMARGQPKVAGPATTLDVAALWGPGFQPVDLEASGQLICAQDPVRGVACTRGPESPPWTFTQAVTEFAVSPIGMCVIPSSGSLNCMPTPEPPPGLTQHWSKRAWPSARGLRDLSCGFRHCCATDSADQAICWSLDDTLPPTIPGQLQ